MSFWFINATARAAWAAATSQQGQLEALAALWSGDVWARLYTSAGTHLATVTYGTPTIDTASTPRAMVLGAWSAESHINPGTAAYCILQVPAGADILRCDVALAGAISDPGGRVRLDIGTRLRVYATAGLPAGTPPTLNEWQQLTVAAHSRKVISTSSPPSSGTYSALTTGAQADVEALTPQTVNAIPYCGYNILIHDGAGTFYQSGSLHSGYRGCEVNIIDVPQSTATEVGIAISHQPTAPPSGPNSGYGSGFGGYVYKQSYAPESVVGFDDQTEALGWKPFIGHDWTMSSWTPTTGFCTMTAHAVQAGQTAGQPYHTGTFTITGGVLQSSHSQPTDADGAGTSMIGLVGFDEASGRFKTWLSQLSSEITSLPGSGWPFTSTSYGLGTSGISDYNPNDGSILLWNSVGSGTYNVIHYIPATHTVRLVASIESSGATAALTGMGGGQGFSQNGWLIRHLENDEYLLLRQSATGRSGVGVFKFAESYGSGDARRVDLTGSLPGSGTGEPFENSGSGSDPLTFCVDKTGRRVFWLVVRTSAAPKIYVSSFDSLMTWTEVVTTGLSTWASAAVWLILNRQPMHYINGYLVLHDNATGPSDPGYHSGAMNLKRCYVGTA